jgi:two-component system, sensor histidine kinase and response regulator
VGAAKILIVDDHPANVVALEATLAPLERTVVRATSGEGALKALLKDRFAVVLLDVQMDGLDGFQTAELIRKRPSTSELPIIFLTAYDAEFRQARRAFRLGAFDYLTKPFDEEILRHKVAAFVRLYEQEEQLRQASESTRLRDVFIGVLGHDLRNPLNTIQMALALLREAKDIPEHHLRTIAKVSRSTDRIHRLVADVLDFTRGQLGGGIPINAERANLTTICEQIVEEARTAHPNREISFTAEGDLVGWWDGPRLAQVVSNLVGNAIQHSTGDPVSVAANSLPGHVRLAVGNPGSMPSEIVPRLFEPFRRGTNHSSGLGLGLYIVREIVRAHGGRVDIESTPGRDETVFVVHLPHLETQRA